MRGFSFPLVRMRESAPAFPGGVFFCARSIVVDLREDCAQVEQAWRGSQERSVQLPVAAAFTFHQTRRNDKRLLSPDDYANALDIAAAALSCLIPIYTPDERGNPVALSSISLARQRFRGGAARIQCDDGAILAPLAIMRNDLLPAIILIERSGIEYLAPA